MGDDSQLIYRSYLYCMDRDLGWGNRTYFTFFSQFNRGESSSLLAGVEATVLVLFFLLSTAFNGAIFYTLSSNRRLRTVTNYFVCNLTLADICFTLCCPLVAVVRVTGSWILGSFACKIVVFLSSVCGFVTIWTLMLIGIDRYTCIVRASKRRITPTMALVLIAAVWIFVLVAFTPLLLYFVVKECPSGDGVVSICSLGWPRTEGINYPVLFTAVVCTLGFVLPTGVLVFCHVRIFVKVYKVKVAMEHQRQRRFSTTSALLAPSSAVWTTHNHNKVTTAAPHNSHKVAAMSVHPNPQANHQRRDENALDVAALAPRKDTIAAQPSRNYDNQTQQRRGGEASAQGVLVLSGPKGKHHQQQKVVAAFRRLSNSSTTSGDGVMSTANLHENPHHKRLQQSSSNSLTAAWQPQEEEEDGGSSVSNPRQRLVVKQSSNSLTAAWTPEEEVVVESSARSHYHPRLSGKQSGSSSSSSSTTLNATRPEVGASPLRNPHSRLAAKKSSGSSSATSEAALTAIPRAPTGTFTALDARKRRSRRDLQVVKTLVYLVLLFFTMWAPIFVVFVLIMKDAYYHVMESSSQVFLAAMCVAYSNALLNPLAYGLSTDKLRDYLRACLACRRGLGGKDGSSPTPQQANHNAVGVGVGLGGGAGGSFAGGLSGDFPSHHHVQHGGSSRVMAGARSSHATSTT